MTLNTAIYVLGETDPHETFWFCRELLRTPEDVPVIDEADKWDDEWDLLNPGGIGLDAWLWVHYRPGEMRRPTDTHEEWCDDDCDGRWHSPPHWFKVTFDTAYSYRGEDGRGCGVLHASLVAQLGIWLDEQSVPWAWQNEFTGETHVGDRYERLYELFSGGDEARRWLNDVVKPIVNEMHPGIRWAS